MKKGKKYRIKESVLKIDEWTHIDDNVYAKKSKDGKGIIIGEGI